MVFYSLSLYNAREVNAAGIGSQRKNRIKRRNASKRPTKKQPIKTTSVRLQMPAKAFCESKRKTTSHLHRSTVLHASISRGLFRLTRPPLYGLWNIKSRCFSITKRNMHPAPDALARF